MSFQCDKCGMGAFCVFSVRQMYLDIFHVSSVCSGGVFGGILRCCMDFL